MWMNRSCLLLVELCIAAIIIVVAVAGRSTACCEHVERVEPLTQHEVAELVLSQEVPKDERLRDNWRRLLDSGDRHYPLLVQLLERPIHSSSVGNICQAFVQTDADKTVPTRAIRHFLRKRFADENRVNRGANMAIILAAGTLGEIGDTSDSELLLMMFRHPRDTLLGQAFWRVSLIEALAKIGDSNTADELEALLEELASDKDRAAIQRDPTFAKGYQAVGQIKFRLLLEKRGAIR